MRRMTLLALMLCAACGGNNENNATNNNTNSTTANNTVPDMGTVEDMATTPDMAGGEDVGGSDMGADAAVDAGPTIDEAADSVRQNASDARARAASGSLADRFDLLLYAARAEAAVGDDEDAAAEGLMPLNAEWNRLQNEAQIDSNEKSIRSLRRLNARRIGTAEEGEFDDALAAQQALRQRLIERRMMFEMLDGGTTTAATHSQKLLLTHTGIAEHTVSADFSSNAASMNFRITCYRPPTHTIWSRVPSSTDTSWDLTVNGLGTSFTVDDSNPETMGSFAPTTQISSVEIATGTTDQLEVECLIEFTASNQELSETVDVSEEEHAQIEESTNMWNNVRNEGSSSWGSDFGRTTATEEEQDAVVEAVTDVVEESSEAIAHVAGSDPGVMETGHLRGVSIRSKLFRRSAIATLEALPEDYEGTRETLRSLIRATVTVGNTALHAADDSAGVLTVTSGVDTGMGSLADLVANAESGATIVVDTLTVPSIDHSAQALTIDKSVTIIGDPVNQTTIQGGADSAIIVNAPGEVVVLQNLTITGGNAANGAGLRVLAGDVTIASSAFTDNTATGDGGAIFVAAGARVVVEDSTFTGNSAARGGASSGDAVLRRCTVESNTATMAGGALHNPTLVRNSVFQSNTAANGGAIAYTGMGPYTLDFSTFELNDASTAGGAVALLPMATVAMFGNNFGGGNTAPMAPAVREGGTLMGSYNVTVDPSGAPALAAGTNIDASGATTLRVGLSPTGEALDSVAAPNCAERAASQDVRGVARTSTPCDAGAYEITDCPNDCSGNGLCESDQCLCVSPWVGSACDMEREGL